MATNHFSVVGSQDLLILYSLQTRDDFLGMVEIDLAHVHIPHELVGIPVSEASYILSARSHRPYSSVKGSVRLSLSYVTDSTRPAVNYSSDIHDDDWEQLNVSGLVSENGLATLPEGKTSRSEVNFF